MADIGQTWEMYSHPEGRWVRVIVAKVEGGGVLLRYEGALEFLTVETSCPGATPGAKAEGSAGRVDG